MTSESLLHTISVVLAIIGTWLLVREVNHGHHFEEVSHGFLPMRELLLVYHLDKNEFILRHQMWALNMTREQAQGNFDSMDAAQRKSLADTWYQVLDDQAGAATSTWFGPVAVHQLKIRRRWLWTGFWSLMASFGLELVIAAGRAARILG